MTASLRDGGTRVRSLRKKLSQIQSLEDMLACGTLKRGDLSTDQAAKISRKQELVEELETLCPSSMGCDEPHRKVNDPVNLENAIPSLEATSEGLVATVPRPRLHSERWEDDPVAVEDVAPVAEAISANTPVVSTEILEAFQPFGPATRADPYLRKLVHAVSELSMEAFETNVLEGVTRKAKWRLALLVQPREQVLAEEPWGGLVGFIACMCVPHVRCVSIAKVAVVPEHRGKGHGHKLMQWCINMAKKQPDMDYISLTSLPTAVRFYKQIGFRQGDVDLSKLDTSIDDDRDFVEGQIYMEYRCRGRGRCKNRGM